MRVASTILIFLFITAFPIVFCFSAEDYAVKDCLEEDETDLRDEQLIAPGLMILEDPVAEIRTREEIQKPYLEDVTNPAEDIRVGVEKFVETCLKSTEFSTKFHEAIGAEKAFEGDPHLVFRMPKSGKSETSFNTIVKCGPDYGRYSCFTGYRECPKYEPVFVDCGHHVVVEVFDAAQRADFRVIEQPQTPSQTGPVPQVAIAERSGRTRQSTEESELPQASFWEDAEESDGPCGVNDIPF